MRPESNLYYLCTPREVQPVSLPVEVVSIQDFLTDEPACKAMWEFISTQFRTRGKFLAVWPGVRYVALHRDEFGEVTGLLLVTAPINWQIDYVVVREDHRHQGVACALVQAALNRAMELNVPYVMLTSREGLRPLYESCGFRVVASEVPAERNLGVA